MDTALFPFADEEGKVGYFDRDLNIVIPPMDGGIADIFLGGFSEGLALIRDEKTSLKGFINTKGETVIPPKFRMAEPFCEGMARVSDGGAASLERTKKEVVVYCHASRLKLFLIN